MTDLLGGIKRWGGNLLEMAEAYGGHQYRPTSMPVPEELVGPEMAAALQEQYDRQFRVARDQAIRGGVGFFGMDDYGHVGAQNRYAASMNDAITQAQTLRQQRMDDDRRKAVADHIARLSGLDPEDPNYIDPMDLSLLQSMEPDKATEALLRMQVPEAGGLAGTLQMIKGGDGYWWQVPRDGGPPVNTGIKVQDPAAVLTDQFRIGNEDYEEFQRRQAFVKRYGAEEAAVQSEAEARLPGVINGIRSAVQRLEAVRDRVAELPSGRIEGKIREQFDAEFQAVAAILNEAALENIAALADRGVRLNPITENELKLLLSTSAQLQNEPEANVEILNSRIESFYSRLMQAYELLDWIDGNRSVLDYRPKAYQDWRNSGQGSPDDTDTDQGVDPPPPGGILVPPERN